MHRVKLQRKHHHLQREDSRGGLSAQERQTSWPGWADRFGYGAAVANVWHSRQGLLTRRHSWAGDLSSSCHHACWVQPLDQELEEILPPVKFMKRTSQFLYPFLLPSLFSLYLSYVPVSRLNLLPSSLFNSLSASLLSPR
jgi:hypothetical protein